jgi:hypothetical protein
MRALPMLRTAFSLRQPPAAPERSGAGAHRFGFLRRHDADRFHQLVEEVLVGFVEAVERSQLDHRLDVVLEQRRQDSQGTARP